MDTSLSLLEPSAIARIRATFAAVTENYKLDFPRLTISCRDVNAQGQKLNGETAFERHYQMMMLLTQALQQRRDPIKPIRILAAPSSIGCEAYTLSAYARKAGLHETGGFTIDAFDASKTFTQLARIGAYPAELTTLLAEKWCAFLFAADGERQGLVPVHEAIRSHVRFLEPQSFENFAAQSSYDVAVMNNLFQYMDEAQIGGALKTVTDAHADLIVFNREKPNHLPVPMPEFYCNITDHSDWAQTRLSQTAYLHKHYRVWARDAGPK